MSNIFSTKPIDLLLREAGGESTGKSLKKVLGAFGLTMLGIGAIVGTGIFVLTGIAAANYSGPGLMISFVIAGLACACAALCYAEFAAMVPVAGSAYTYGYASLGEIWAWIIGWDLILEYTVAVAAVSIGWSGYVTSLLSSIGINLPAYLANPPGINGGIVNLPAIFIVLLITFVLFRGVRESSTFNNIIVVIKVVVILIFIILGALNINSQNWHPFLPYGWSGVFKGASMIFFAYIGFDAVSTAAEEVRNPQRDMPRGIIGSLAVCTLLYILVSGVLTGIVPFMKLKDTSAPVAYALSQIGISWGSALVSVGAVCGITSVILVMMYGQTRILYAMSRDGLLPKVFSNVHNKYGTPSTSTLIMSAVVIVMSGFLQMGEVAELTNIGTLAAFVIVSAAVIVLRKRRPDIKRSFKCPWVPFIPAAAIIICGYLIVVLPTVTHIRFVVWLVIGFVVYFLYSKNHSVVRIKGK